MLCHTFFSYANHIFELNDCKVLQEFKPTLEEGNKIPSWANSRFADSPPIRTNWSSPKPGFGFFFKKPKQHQHHFLGPLWQICDSLSPFDGAEDFDTYHPGTYTKRCNDRNAMFEKDYLAYRPDHDFKFYESKFFLSKKGSPQNVEVSPVSKTIADVKTCVQNFNDHGDQTEDQVLAEIKTMVEKAIRDLTPVQSSSVGEDADQHLLDLPEEQLQEPPPAHEIFFEYIESKDTLAAVRMIEKYQNDSEVLSLIFESMLQPGATVAIQNMSDLKDVKNQSVRFINPQNDEVTGAIKTVDLHSYSYNIVEDATGTKHTGIKMQDVYDFPQHDEAILCSSASNQYQGTRWKVSGWTQQGFKVKNVPSGTDETIPPVKLIFRGSNVLVRQEDQSVLFGTFGSLDVFKGSGQYCFVNVEGKKRPLRVSISLLEKTSPYQHPLSEEPLPSPKESSIINAQDAAGRTMLHYTAMLGLENITEILLSYYERLKASFDVRDSTGRTPLHHAVVSSPKVANTLLRYGDDPARKTSTMTPIQHAQDKDAFEVLFWTICELDNRIERFTNWSGLLEIQWNAHLASITNANRSELESLQATHDEVTSRYEILKQEEQQQQQQQPAQQQPAQQQQPEQQQLNQGSSSSSSNETETSSSAISVVVNQSENQSPRSQNVGVDLLVKLRDIVNSQEDSGEVLKKVRELLDSEHNQQQANAV